MHNIIVQFLLSNVDGIITDEVETAKYIKETLKDSSDLNRVMNWLRPES